MHQVASRAPAKTQRLGPCSAARDAAARENHCLLQDGREVVIVQEALDVKANEAGALTSMVSALQARAWRAEQDAAELQAKLDELNEHRAHMQAIQEYESKLSPFDPRSRLSSFDSRF